MKRVLLIMMIVLLLGGCSKNSNGDAPNDQRKDVSLTEIEWCGIDWDQIEFPVDLSEIEGVYDAKPIETKENAIAIGTVIIEEFHKKGKALEYSLLSIVHSTEDNIWRFDYSVDQRNVDIDNLIDYGGLHVAIDGNTGKLIQVWVVEG